LVSDKDNKKTQAIKGSGVVITEGNLMKDTQTELSTLEHRQRLSVKSHTKLKKKFVVKKKVDELYVAPALSPYLLLIISLLYMVAADGLIREDEISLLQSVTGADKSIINIALKYTQKIKLSEFLIIAPPLLQPKDKICILLNILDLMLIDGNTAEEELDYFFQLQEVFGLTDAQMKPYLSILKIKTNRKILGDFNPERLSTQEFTPHLIFGIALIFMLSADGIVNENEVEQLQSNISSFPGLFEAASKYSKSNTVEQFLWDIRSRLNHQQSLFVLINTYDLLLSDGVADEHEQTLFDRFLASLDLDRKRFKNYADLIELKNKRPTKKICKVAEIYRPSVKANSADSSKRETTASDHHLREIDTNEKLVLAPSAKNQKSLGQTIKNDANDKEIHAFVHPSEQKNNTVVTSLTAKAANIQKAKSGLVSENIQDVAATEQLHSSETKTGNTADHIQEKLITESKQTSNQTKKQANELTTQVNNDQYIHTEASVRNSQRIESDQDTKNVQSLGEVQGYAKAVAMDINLKEGENSNPLPLDETIKATNLQKLDEPLSSVNSQSLDPITTHEKIQPVTTNDTLDLNRQSISAGPQPEKANPPSVNQDVFKGTQKSIINLKNNSLNLQNLSSDSIKNSQARVGSIQGSANSSNEVNDPVASKGMVDIESNVSLSNLSFKENLPPPFQERFAAIHSEINDVHEKLDQLEDYSHEKYATVDISNKTTSNTPSVEPIELSQNPPIPTETLLQSAIETQVNPNLTNVSHGSTHNPNSDYTKKSVDDIGLNSRNEAPASFPIAKTKAFTTEIHPDNRKGQINKSSEKNKIPKSPSKSFEPESDLSDKTSESSNVSQLVKSPINSNNQPLEGILERSDFATLDSEDRSQADVSIDSPTPSKSNPKTVDIQIAQQTQPRGRNVEKENLAVFTLSAQIVLDKSYLNFDPVVASGQLQIFDEISTVGLTISEVFVHQPRTLVVSDHYSRITHSSKILEPNRKSRSTQKFTPKVTSTFIKASAMAGIAALISLYSFDTNIDIYAPCPGQTCEGKQTGAPLMIKPEPSALLQNVFSALDIRLDHES